jgi:hypothetical protein
MVLNLRGKFSDFRGDAGDIGCFENFERLSRYRLECQIFTQRLAE